ncbi:MAG: hypothetical protein K6E18_00985 [Lachnospiraceae bacterium]|nr:hypothetical protein [Lachnospiraceae bacterium]
MLLAACGKSKDDGAGIVYAPEQQLGGGSKADAAGAGDASFDGGSSSIRPSGGSSDASYDTFGGGDLSDDAAGEDDSGSEDGSDEKEDGSSGDLADAGRSEGGSLEQSAGSGDLAGADASDAVDAAGGNEGGSGSDASDGSGAGAITGGLATGGEAGSEAGSEGGAANEEALDENGVYTTLADVSLYLYTYEKLPVNFITKKQARSLGWSGGGLDPYANGLCIGGDVFGNYEGLLPQKKGRVYHECDIDTLHQKSRGAKRIVYSDDGLIYYTDDHYDSFTLIYEGWASSQAE